MSLHNWIAPIRLQGNHVWLEPLSPKHHDDLVEATKDGALWKKWYTFVPEPENMHEAINERLALQEAGNMIPFAVISLATGKAIGMTTYLNIDASNKRVEVGATWYRKSAQRTAVNTECKWLLLQHAFENLACIAVEFRTHYFNVESRKAIERLGAKLDGILRNHMVMPNNTLRDTCVYSIIASEWPTVKACLSYMLI